MRGAMAAGAPPHRLLVTHVEPEGFAPLTSAMLRRLGYQLVDSEKFEADAESDERPDLRIVDERRLAEVPDAAEEAVPIVLLTGRFGAVGADPRVVGAIRRPAALHELYRLVQVVLEESPRSAPRVDTHLPVRLRRDEREWRGAVLCLSESGCLVRTPERVLLGDRLQLSFTLPRSGRVEVEGEAAYQLVPDVGVVFHAVPPRVREAIGRYVVEALSSPWG
jgi:hypothetical protein